MRIDPTYSLRRCGFTVALAVALSASVVDIGRAQDPFAGVRSTGQTEQERDPAVVRLLGSSAWLNAPSVDVQIALWLRQVLQGRIGAQEFFERAGAAGVGMKHINAVKTKIETAGAATDFLGRTFAEGGTPVERTLLTWRRARAEASMKESLRSVTHNATVFVGFAGNWPTQHPNALTFSGDIDFSYVTADPNLSLKLKQRFEADFHKSTKMPATEKGADVVATAHGRAGLEVYIAKSGQSFAERTMTNLQRADAGGGLTPVSREHAFARIAVEGDLIGPSAVRPAKSNAEPGLSMEMARHYTRDIVRADHFSLRDQIVKAAKYLDRAMKSAGVPAGAEDLAAFAAEVTKHAQKADIKALAQRIGEHFGDGLSVRMVDGRLVVDMDATRLARFQREITATIWDGARNALEKRVGHLEARFAAAEALTDEKERARAIEEIRSDYVALVDMMKTEFLALSHENVDVPKPIRDLDVRLTALDRFLVAHGRGLTAEELKDLRMLKEMSQSKSTIAHRFAIGRLVHLAWQTVERTNHILDYLDDRWLGSLRRYSEVDDLIKEVSAIRADLNSKDRKRADDARERLKAGQQKAAEVIRSVNVALNQDIQAFAAARGAVKVVMVKGLIDEYLAYRDAFARSDWNGLAMEFFRRRVPFGTAAENAAMGNEVLAVVDVVTTLVPHLALARAVEGIAEEVDSWAIEYYWAEELKNFVNGLYASAQFTQVGVTNYQQATVEEWRLATVTYGGETFNLGKPPAGKKSYLALKRAQIKSMHEEQRKRLGDRELYRQFAYTLTDRHKVDWILHKNLAATDPFLMLMEELQHRPDVGSRLKEHFFDQYLTRWEEVKFAFMLKLIVQLEDRWTAERALAAKKLPAMFAELMEIARDLDIVEPMKKAMDIEAKRFVPRYEVWLKWLGDFKGDLLREPAEESDDARAAEVVKRHLDLYRSIREIRRSFERETLQGRPVADQGLRFLTGSRFLTGQREIDQKNGQQWSERITAYLHNAEAELLAIKAKYADPKGPKPVLDNASGSFDRNSKMGLVREDVWRAAWISMIAVAQGEPAKQDTAKSIANRHKLQRDQIVKDFEAHYAKLAKPGDKDISLNDCLNNSAAVREYRYAAAMLNDLRLYRAGGLPGIAALSRLLDSVSCPGRRMNPHAPTSPACCAAYWQNKKMSKTDADGPLIECVWAPKLAEARPAYETAMRQCQAQANQASSAPVPAAKCVPSLADPFCALQGRAPVERK